MHYLPPNVRESRIFGPAGPTVLGFTRNGLQEWPNTSLFLNKFFHYVKRPGEIIWSTDADFNRQEGRSSRHLDKEQKTVHVKNTLEIYKKNMRAISSFYDSLFERNFYFSNNINQLWFFAQTTCRLLINYSANNSVEAGLALHPLYGFPYIPGSAIKGLAASQFFEDKGWLKITDFKNGTDIQRIANKIPGKTKEEDIKEFCNIFGAPAFQIKNKKYPAYSGEIIFMDAWPVRKTWLQGKNFKTGQEVPKEENWLEEDIWTVHYPDYYDQSTLSPARQEKYPGDNQSPRPLLHIAVSAGVIFCFCVRWTLWEKDLNTNLLTTGSDYLQRGLQEIGIGSKTSSNYGYFQILAQNKEGSL